MSNFSKVTVALLAGGFGTRLQSVVKDKPKVLAEVRKRPFLEYLLKQLDDAHFENIVICTYYLGDKIQEIFGGKYKNINLLYSQEKKPLGTAGALRNALPLLHSETILVMNGDSFCKVNFKKFWEFHLGKKSKATLALTLVPDTSRYGTVQLGSDNSIIWFHEKREKTESGFINAGIYLINKSLIEEIPKNKKISFEKDVFPTWIDKGFYGFKTQKNFIDIGTPESYTRADEFFAKYTL